MTNQAPFTPITCVHYDHIISKPVLSKEEDFKNFINRDSKVSPLFSTKFLKDFYETFTWWFLQHEFSLIGDHELRSLKKGDRIQLQRRGYYICDSPYQAMSRYTGRETPLVLINIPDGHTKDMPKFGSKHKEATEVTLNFKL